MYLFKLVKIYKEKASYKWATQIICKQLWPLGFYHVGKQYLKIFVSALHSVTEEHTPAKFFLELTYPWLKAPFAQEEFEE